MNKEIELVLQQNQLPKVNMMFLSVLKELGRREKIDKDGKLDTPHQLANLVLELEKDETRYTEQIRNIKEYLEHLNIQQIVTPVHKMADFLDEDLIETDPSFYGEVISRFKRTDDEHKIIMNKPVKASKHWVKWVGIIAIMGLIGAAAFLLLGQGQGGAPPDLSHLIPGFTPIPTPGQTSTADFQKLYPDPYLAKKALESGQLTENQIPPELRNLVKNAKPPVVTPIPEPPKNLTVNLGP